MHEDRSEPDAAPTITTVARLANVSVASASRVLNGIRTNPETLARVREAAAAIGYAPNAAARSLRSRRTGQIAFAMPDVANPVYTTMVSSIQEVAREAGCRLMLHSTGADAEDELEMLRDLKQRFVDGLILCSLHLTEAHAAELVSAAAPVVVIGRPPAGTPVDTVQANSRKGAAEAVRHLHEAGRRRIGFVNGPEGTTPGSSRRRGYLDGLRSCGLGRDEALCEVAADFMVEAGRYAATRLLARTKPDALFCANDLLAAGALAALREAGRRRPARRRGGRDGQHRPRGADLAFADDHRPRLGRARARRGGTARQEDRRPRPAALHRQGRAAPRRPRLVGHGEAQ